MGSGAARASAAKGIADYRLGLLREQAGQRAKLRSDVLQSTQGAPGTPYTVTPVEGQESTGKGMLKQYGGMAMGGFCWIAAAIYGDGTPEFIAARRWIFYEWTGPVAACVRFGYRHFGQQIAKSPWLCGKLKPLFDIAVQKGKC